MPSVTCPVCQRVHLPRTSASGTRGGGLEYGCLLVYVQARCPICLDEAAGPPVVSLPCGHALCRDDFRRIGGSFAPDGVGGSGNAGGTGFPAEQSDVDSGDIAIFSDGEGPPLDHDLLRFSIPSTSAPSTPSSNRSAQAGAPMDTDQLVDALEFGIFASMVGVRVHTDGRSSSSSSSSYSSSSYSSYSSSSYSDNANTDGATSEDGERDARHAGAAAAAASEEPDIARRPEVRRGGESGGAEPDFGYRRERGRGGRRAPWDRYFARDEWWSRLTAGQRRTISDARRRGDADPPPILGLMTGAAPSSAPCPMVEAEAEFEALTLAENRRAGDEPYLVPQQERNRGGRRAPWDRYLARDEWSRLTAGQKRTISDARRRGDANPPSILGLAMGMAPSSAPRPEAQVEASAPVEDLRAGADLDFRSRGEERSGVRRRPPWDRCFSGEEWWSRLTAGQRRTISDARLRGDADPPPILGLAMGVLPPSVPCPEAEVEAEVEVEIEASTSAEDRHEGAESYLVSRQERGRSAPWNRYFAKDEWSRLTTGQRRTVLDARRRGDADPSPILGLGTGAAPSSAPCPEVEAKAETEVEASTLAESRREGAEPYLVSRQERNRGGRRAPRDRYFAQGEWSRRTPGQRRTIGLNVGRGPS